VRRPWRDGDGGAGAHDADADAAAAAVAAAVAWPNFVIFANLSCLALWDFEQESHKMLSLVFVANSLPNWRREVGGEAWGLDCLPALIASLLWPWPGFWG